jgi:hypothetical protein
MVFMYLIADRLLFCFFVMLVGMLSSFATLHCFVTYLMIVSFRGKCFSLFTYEARFDVCRNLHYH